MKIFRKLFLLEFLVLLGAFGCSSVNSQNKMKVLTGPTNSQINSQDYKSDVGKQNLSSWKTKTIKIGNDDIRKTYFHDEAIGYAITFSNTIYKTSNGGEAWEKVNSIANFVIMDVFFTTPEEGFVIAYKIPKSSYEDKNESYIMKTSDGGQHWETVYLSKSIILERLILNSNGLGWAVGRKKIESPIPDSVNFALSTKDNGKTWLDVSESLNQLSKNEQGQVSDYLTNIAFSKDNGVIALSLRGKLYITTDVGKSWRLINTLTGEPSQTRIGYFGELENGEFWVAGGTISEEGKWGMIAITKSLNWERFRLGGYYFSDVKFFTDVEVIATGSIVAKNNFGGANESNKGVILYSSNSGKDWMIIHESSVASEFTSIDRLSENKMLISGRNGAGIILERPLKTTQN